MKRYCTVAMLTIVALFASSSFDATAETVEYQQTFGVTGIQATTSGEALNDYSGWTYYESADDDDSFADVASAGTLTLSKGATSTALVRVTSQEITGAAAFDVSTIPTTVSVQMTGTGSAGGFHVGLVFGDVELYFHPGYSGGYVRIGKVRDSEGNANILHNFGDVGYTFAQGTMTDVSVTLLQNGTDISKYDVDLSVGAYTNTVQLLKSDVGSFSSVGLLIDGDSNLAAGSFANLNVSTAIPEPGTFALGTAGLIALLAYAWRKRK